MIGFIDRFFDFVMKYIVPLVCPVCFSLGLFLFVISDLLDRDDTYPLICLYFLFGLIWDHLFCKSRPSA